MKIKRLFKLLLVLVPLVGVPGETYAQQDCRSIEDGDDRLRCYDQQRDERTPDDSETLAGRPDADDSSDESLLISSWDLDNKHGKFVFRSYKPVYFFPLFWADETNTTPTTSNPRTTVTDPINLDRLEAKFQLSFKTRLAEDLIGDDNALWLAYTQTSRWQIYNTEESRPFRETNHEPEFILTWKTDYQLMGLNGRLFSLSLNHQSNGQDEPLSRSWNRLILSLGLDRPDWVVMLRPWWRIPESSDEEDENPDIDDFVGRGELLVVHRRSNSHQVSLSLRHALRTDNGSHGSLNLNWSYPCFDRLRCHVQLFHGYGESLIDYNHRTTALGIGVNLLEWFADSDPRLR